MELLLGRHLACVAALLAVAGCDYVLGLKEHADARVDDGVVDRPSEMKPDDCPRDTFGGQTLNPAKWTAVGGGNGVTLVVDNGVHFDVSSGGTNGTRGVRSNRMFDLTIATPDVIAELAVPPTGGASTNLNLYQAGGLAYAIEVVGNAAPQVKFYVGAAGSNPIPLGIARYLRIRDAGTQVKFGLSADNVTFTEMAFTKGASLAGVSVELATTKTGTPAAGFRVTWARIVVDCP